MLKNITTCDTKCAKKNLAVLNTNIMKNSNLQHKFYTPQRLDTLTIKFMTTSSKIVEKNIPAKNSLIDILSKLSRLAANPFKI